MKSPIDQLQSKYDSTGQHLRAIEEGLLSLEGRPEDPETLQLVFRMAHTLKGNSASVGLIFFRAASLSRRTYSTCASRL